MAERDIQPTVQRYEQLLREVAEAASQEHVPEDVLRAYLGQPEEEEEIENHLLECEECQATADRIMQEAADKIAAEVSPWHDEPEGLVKLRELLHTAEEDMVNLSGLTFGEVRKKIERQYRPLRPSPGWGARIKAGSVDTFEWVRMQAHETVEDFRFIADQTERIRAAFQDFGRRVALATAEPVPQEFRGAATRPEDSPGWGKHTGWLQCRDEAGQYWGSRVAFEIVDVPHISAEGVFSLTLQARMDCPEGCVLRCTLRLDDDTRLVFAEPIRNDPGSGMNRVSMQASDLPFSREADIPPQFIELALIKQGDMAD